MNRKGSLNQLLGGGLAVIGVLCGGLAIYLTEGAVGQSNGSEVEARLTRCQGFLSTLSFEHVRMGEQLSARRRSIDNPERLLADASLALLACDLPLVQFCMGPGCRAPSTPDAITFTLSTALTSPSTASISPPQ